MRHRTTIESGLIYGVGLFAAGFMLGTLRVMVVAPRFGDMAAVAMELPLMLGFAWVFAGWIVGPEPAQGSAHWLAAGATGFAVLMLAEAILGLTVFGLSLTQFLSGLVSGPGALGFGAQIISAFFPWARFRLAQRVTAR
ncbi:MAG: hypothetical protein MUC58_09200 [Rhizobiaceae bacterium]|nr:hypothetical protein [Rhizobiaceae bacterium]